MKIDLVFCNTTRDRSFTNPFFKDIIRRTFRLLGKGRKNIEVSVSLVGENKIRSLNRKFRKKDSITDVLSFPLGEDALTGYTSVRTLGDLFICMSYARTAARREGVPIKSKLKWLTVHGVLHLLGYDHERSAKDAAVMERLEQKILRQL
ncbi:MAG: rRNA maturation RNase YbeY [Patescibacteria group bacterium]